MCRLRVGLTGLRSRVWAMNVGLRPEAIPTRCGDSLRQLVWGVWSLRQHHRVYHEVLWIAVIRI